MHLFTEELSRQTHDANFVGVLQCVAVCCSVSQRVAVCHSMLQCVTVCCSVSQCVAVCVHLFGKESFGHTNDDDFVGVCCSVSQCVAVCCSVRALVAQKIVSTDPCH